MIQPHRASLPASPDKIAAMEKPPKFFAAGSDALDAIRPALEERLAAMRAFEPLSNSTLF